MPKKPETPVVENQSVENVPTIQPKRTRKMTPELLEKLQQAREMALKAKKEGKQINDEHKEIKETFGQKVNDIETFKKIKEKVSEEVSKNEIVSINKKMEELHNKFDGYLQEKVQRRQLKAEQKQQKKANQIVKELPGVVSQHILEEELKKLELARWQKRLFGI
jgi:Tfp pilus assembly protein FimT